jgi:hypothetical protein
MKEVVMNFFKKDGKGAFIGIVFMLSVLGLAFLFGTPKTEDLASVLAKTVVAENGEEVSVFDAFMDKYLGEIKKDISEIKSQLSFENNYAVILLDKEFGQMTTAEEVYERIRFLEENKWNAQLSALSVINRNVDAKEALRRLINYDQVFVAIANSAKPH